MLAALFTAAAIVTFSCAPVRADYDTGYQKFKSSYLDHHGDPLLQIQRRSSVTCISPTLSSWLGSTEEAKKFFDAHKKDIFNKEKLLASKPLAGGMTFGDWLDLHQLTFEIERRTEKLLTNALIVQNADLIPSSSKLILERLFPLEWKTDDVPPVPPKLEAGACTPPLGLPLDKSLGSFGIENFTQIGVWPQPKIVQPITLKTIEKQAKELLKTWYRKTATEDPIVSVTQLERQLSQRLPTTPENQSKIRLFTSFLLSHLGMDPMRSKNPRELGNPQELGRAISNFFHSDFRIENDWEGYGCDMLVNEATFPRSEKIQAVATHYEQTARDAIRPIALAQLSHLQDEVAPSVKTLSQETRFFHYVPKGKRHDPKSPKIRDWIREFVTFRANQAMGSQLIAQANAAGDGLYVATEPGSSRIYGGSNPALYEVALNPGSRILIDDQNRLTNASIVALNAADCPSFFSGALASQQSFCRELFQKILRELKIDLFHYSMPLKYNSVSQMKCRFISELDGDLDWLVLVSPQNVNWAHTQLHTQESSTASEKHRRLILSLSHRDGELGHTLTSVLGHVPILGPIFESSPREIEEYKKKYQLGCQE
ncbi:hypothetical protein WDW37_11030 [Bdellovibrionota bacterium FG-1]